MLRGILDSYGGGLGPFDPSQLSGLIFWLDASNAGSITQSGGNVSQWNDLSATGANFTQSTSIIQPAYVASAINGKPGIDFTGTKTMVNSTSLIGDGTNPRTIIVVSSFSSYVGGAYAFLMTFLGPSAGNSPQLLFSNQAGYNNIFFGAKLTGGAFGAVRTSADFGSFGVYATGLTYNGSGAGVGNYTFYKSNVAKTTVAGADDTDTVAANCLGANDPGGGYSNTGPICEFMIYNRVLNSTELAQIQTYINGKYAL
jgi:hypothetical protein